MKKISLALATAGLTASLGAYAAVPTDAQPFQVVVPNLKAGIEVTLEGLWLRPSNTDLDYAVIAQPTLNLTNGGLPLVYTNAQSINQADPDYNFGFRVGLGYIFPDSGNDIQLNWTHFDHDDSSSVTTLPGQVLVTDLGVPLINFQPGFLDGLIVVTDAPNASSSADYNYDAVDLDAGQYLDIGTRLRLRMFGGLRFARVESNRSDSYAAAYNLVDDGDVIGTLTYNETDSLNSEFNGVGARFGVDSSYHIANCFGFIGHVAGALLVGNTDTTTNTAVNVAFNPDPGQIFAGSTSTSSSDDITRVVPAFDAKLGFDYTFIFANQSMFSIEAGYQWTQYIDAVERLNTNFIPGTISRTTSSVGFDGPYLTLNWKV